MENKFRAWDRDNETMIYSDNPQYLFMCDSTGELRCYDHDGGMLNELNISQIMPYTGLRDMEGKYIYECDILRFPPTDSRDEKSFIGYEVFYHDNDGADNHIGFQCNRMRFYGNLCGGENRAKFLPKYTSKMIIISNIHQETKVLELA